MYICEICGKIFKKLRPLTLHIPRQHHIDLESYYCLAFDKEPNKCRVCGKDTKFKNYREGYREYCSPKCASIGTVDKRRDLFMETYGVDNPMKSTEIKTKHVDTIIDRYGVSNVSKLDDVKQRKRETILRNYGVDNPSKAEQVKVKRVETFKRRFGTDNPNKNREVRFKLEQTNISRYGTTCVFSNSSIKNKIKNKLRPYYYDKLSSRLEHCKLVTPLDEYISAANTRFKVECNTCGKVFEVSLRNGCEPLCKKCHGSRTKIETIVEDILVRYNINYIFRYRSIKGIELDFYLPDFNIAIEVDGLYWHSQQILYNLTDNPKLYHLNKTILCATKGIQLLHFFEDEVLYKTTIVENIILAKTGNLKFLAGARECTVVTIDSKTANMFLDITHIHGRSRGKCIYIGAFYDENLVGVMVFKIGNITHKNKTSCYLDKFASKAYYNIPGLASKMLRFFINNYQYGEIHTYADRRFSDGNVYNKLGFCLDSITPPNYFYVVKGKRYHRYTFRKSVLKDKLQTFDPNKTEYQNMLANKIDRVWDCGHLKFLLL